MLVLSRRIGEEIVIDENIRIVVADIQGNKVRLGIGAPPSVRVDRREVHVQRWRQRCPKGNDLEAAEILYQRGGVS